MIDLDKLYALLDHIELINWIKYMSYSTAKVGYITKNLDNREYIKLPSGKKVVITIEVKEYK